MVSMVWIEPPRTISKLITQMTGESLTEQSTKGPTLESSQRMYRRLLSQSQAVGGSMSDFPPAPVEFREPAITSPTSFRLFLLLEGA